MGSGGTVTLHLDITESNNGQALYGDSPTLGALYRLNEKASNTGLSNDYGYGSYVDLSSVFSEITSVDFSTLGRVGYFDGTTVYETTTSSYGLSCDVTGVLKDF